MQFEPQRRLRDRAGRGQPVLPGSRNSRRVSEFSSSVGARGSRNPVGLPAAPHCELETRSTECNSPRVFVNLWLRLGRVLGVACLCS